MTKYQKLLIVEAGHLNSKSEEIARANGCVAYFTGIPISLMHQATTEGWVLPHIYTESWEDPDPELQ
jgi:hypothetical protein